MYECFKVKLAIGAENNYYQCPAYAMKIKEPSSLSTPASTFFEVTKKTCKTCFEAVTFFSQTNDTIIKPPNNCMHIHVSSM